MLPTCKYEKNRAERILLYVQSQTHFFNHYLMKKNYKSEEALETKQDRFLGHSSL